MNRLYLNTHLVTYVDVHTHSLARIMALQGSYFGPSSGPIFLDQLHCSGGESSLLDCNRFAGLGLYTCDHLHEAGVRCPAGQR